MALRFSSVLKSLQNARASRSRQRLAKLRRDYARTWLRCEQLESRRVLATLYVDNPADYAITTDQGAGGLDNGDTVTWNAGAGSEHSPSTVAGLTFGTHAFGTIQDAINAANAGDVIRVAGGTFIESVNVNETVNLLGNQVGDDAQDGRVGDPETIVQGVGGFTAFNVSVSDVVLNGFTVQGTTSGTGVFGITLSGGTSGSEVRNNIIQNNIAGISLANNSAGNATVIEGNLIQNNNQPGPLNGTGIFSDEINAGGALTNVLITNNTITGHINPGINLFFNSPAIQASDIEISSNIITNNANGVLFTNVISSTITRNEFFSNIGNQIIAGGGVDDLTITENFVENGGANGIRITNFGVGPANQNIVINRNSIENNAGAGISILAGQYVGTLNAEFNWWGSSTGPTHPNNPGGTGENIADPGLQVDFIPFLTNGADAQPAIRGFQPSPPAPAPTTDLSVTKTDNKTTTFNGDTLIYQIVVTNTGTSDALNVTLRDVLPSEVSFVTIVAPPGWTVITTNSGGVETVTATTSVLAAGATANFVLTVIVDNGSPGDVIENTSVVTTTTVDTNTANNAATDTTIIPAPPSPTPGVDISVSKDDTTDPVSAGRNITYTINVTNFGDTAAANVTLTDAIPAGTTFVSFAEPAGWASIEPAPGGTGTVTSSNATLAAGATATFTLVVATSVTADNGSVVTNTASATTTSTDTAPGNNSDTESTIVINQADVSVDKTGPATITAGTRVIETITVTNNGPSDAFNVVVSEVLPPGITESGFAQSSGPPAILAFNGTDTFTATIPVLAAGETAVFLVGIDVPPNFPAGSTITNTASVDSDTNDPVATNDTDTAPSLITTSADLAVSKTDLSDPVIAGQNVVYTITVTNSGPSDAQNVTVTDTLPAGTTFVSATPSQGTASGAGTTATGNFGTIAAGGSATLTIVAQVASSVPHGTVLTNTVTVASNTSDPNAANNTDTEDTVVNAQAELTIIKTDAPDPVNAGNNLTYTVTVTNTGPSDAQNVVVTDTLPAGTTFVSATPSQGTATGAGTSATANLGTIAAGGSATVTIVAAVSSAVPQGTTLTNTVTVATTTTETNPGNNSDTETTDVNAQSDLSVTKTDSPDPVVAGHNLTYTIIVTNSGPSDAQNVTLTDVVPADTTFVSFTQTSGPAFTTTTPPAGGTGTVAAAASTLAAGSTATFELVVQVDPLALEGTVISNNALVTTTTTETNPGNNADSETTDVVRPTLPECEVFTLNDPGSPNSAEIVDDADAPGTNVLLVTGSNGNDVIIIEEDGSGNVRVKRNGRNIGVFDEDDVDRIVVHALNGNDKVIIDWDLFIDATVFGGSGNDQLHGGAGDDAFEGGSGNDKIFGGRGNDALCGGSGNDHIYGQQGDDLISGDGGNDKLYGEQGRDVLLGGTGGDHLYGGDQDDRIYGQQNNDKLYGESGNDIAVGGDGNDHVYGGSGRDLVIGGFGADKVYGEGQEDIVIGNATQWDEDDVALMAILSEWTSGRSYEDRVENIRNGGGNNVLITLDDTTVIEDDAKDELFGNGDRDWFFATLRDRIRDRQSGEFVN